MNLDRISIKRGNDTTYMTLAKISDFSKLYTTILFDNNFSMQKINTGDSIQAFNFKNIEQFKGYRPFIALKQDQLLFLNDNYGADFSYQTKLHAGDLVRYNGLKYIVLGIIVNTYAQWNMPTPLLLNPTNINNDFKSLFGSRLTDEQIVKKINDNFQAGKYDADMVIPLVDANDFSEYITIIQPRPTKEEVELMFDSVKAEKDLTIKAQKDVFIDTMLRLRGNEINEIKAVNEDLFKGVQTLLLSVNKAVNEQIELLPEAVVEKPAIKPKEKKVIAPVVKEIEPVVEVDSDELPDFIPAVSFIKDLPEPVIKLIRFRRKELGIKATLDLDILISGAFNWNNASDGYKFWDKINNLGDLREFKEKFGNKGELVDELIEKEELPKPFVEEKQKVEYVEVVIYPAKGGILGLATFSLPELFALTNSVFNKFDMDNLTLKFIAITNLTSYVSKIELNKSDGIYEVLRKIMEQYDTFVKPELDWENFADKKADKDRVKLNKEIIDDAFKPEPKPVPVEKPQPVPVEKPKPVKVEKPKPVVVEKPKPVPVEKPKPVPVEKPKPVPVEKPKPVPVEKPKPVKVEKPKPVKVTKPKVTKPKVEDDLSFLDDLDNIF
jgi:hypothetical protein